MSPVKKAALIAASLAACGTGEESRPAPGPNGYSPAIEQLVAAWCERRVSCPLGRLEYGDAQLCARSFGAIWCESEYQAIELPNLDGCVAAINRMDCDVPARLLPPACDVTMQDILEGFGYPSARRGEACGGFESCEQGTRCDHGGDPNCQGICVASPKVGASCTSLLDCEGDAFCLNGICSPARSSGTACSIIFECQGECLSNICTDSLTLQGRPCSASDECGSNLWCDAGTCNPLRPLNALCDRSDQCLPGLACNAGSCSLVAACREGARGDGCMQGGQCGDELACDKTDRRCVDPAALGETCGIHLRCARGAQCTLVRGTAFGTCEKVRELKANGEACEPWWECQSGYCNAGRCDEAMICR